MRTLLNRRWLSFNLRTALLLFTVATIGFWVYWDGWQRWKWFLEQRTFINSASQLKAGSHIDVQRPLLMESEYPPWWMESGSFDEHGNADVWQSYRWPNAIYIVSWRYDDSYCTSVEVFILPVAPSDYQPRTESGRREVRRVGRPIPAGISRDAYRIANPPAAIAYMNDFSQMIQGDRSDTMGFAYELIHSDLTMKTQKSAPD